MSWARAFAGVSAADSKDSRDVVRDAGVQREFDANGTAANDSGPRSASPTRVAEIVDADMSDTGAPTLASATPADPESTSMDTA